MMENNTYFNHPIPPFDEAKPKVADMREYVTSNPLTVHKDGLFLRTNMLPMASTAVVAGNPFILSEWNEYGVNPFHSTAFISMAAYACLNEWDGLIVYCYHTSESWNGQPADEITNIFDAYNDPSLICQFGFMAALFLGDLVRPAEHRVDLVFTQNDLKTLPPAFSMPNAYLPYITSLRNVFLDQGDAYTGDADVAVTAGFVNNGDLSQAKRAVYYAWSPYRDALRHANGEGRLERLAAKADEELPGAKLGDRILVFNEIAPLAGERRLHYVCRKPGCALKRWGLLPDDRGLVGSALVSDTGELAFDPKAGTFRIRTEGCSYFSGDPSDGIALTKDYFPFSYQPSHLSGIAACKRHFRRMLRNLPFDGPRPHRHGRNHLYHGRLIYDCRFSGEAVRGHPGRNLVRALQVRNAYCSGHGGHANRQHRMRSCS
ncbi:hypothetical protein [Paenibacillus polymyxa]|uniref:hypothetical protein n=1 Tax=Paenibacillus polymyxa TaxID=1406 RepID=UPI0023491531|nr:hypothetical protein [Paenibacillus polymyxa]WCM63775.1 hypothetical protein OYT09_12975 [Paenibacillus polymyxa]